jgi:Heavy metal binding domain
MHPEVRQRGPGNCPKCGMTLEFVVATVPRTEWTCPMHPQIVRDAPGSCPICGMALEPRTVGVVEGPDPELIDMTRRFWIGLVLTLPLLAFVMGDMRPGQPLRHLIPGRFSAWLQLVLATPVVLWAGWPFFDARVLDSKSPRHYAAGSDDAKALVNPSGCHRDRRGDGSYLCGAIPRSRGHRHSARRRSSRAWRRRSDSRWFV